MSKSALSEIIPETCKAIWDALQPEDMPVPDKAKWRMIAEEFEKQWQFPHCCGSNDGKHIQIQCPKNSGSLFFNYKKFSSIVLMAVADAGYKFIVVDVGAYGRQSDGSVFANSVFGKMLKRQQLPLPSDEPLPGCTAPKLLYVFVADEAFPLVENLMRPYPGTGLSREHTIFNYRLSRARRVVENAFGILATRFRCFHRPLTQKCDHVDAIVKAGVILHNFLQEETGGFIETSGDLQGAASRLAPLSRMGRNNCNKATQVRDICSAYFNSAVGSVSWQNNVTQRVM